MEYSFSSWCGQNTVAAIGDGTLPHNSELPSCIFVLSQPLNAPIAIALRFNVSSSSLDVSRKKLDIPDSQLDIPRTKLDVPGFKLGVSRKKLGVLGFELE